MAAAVASPSAGRRHNSIFRSVFPKTTFTTPTPESTPDIGTISSPGTAFGGFNSFVNEADETVRYTRAWSTATRFLALSTAAGDQHVIAADTLEAFSFLLRAGQTRKDLAAWYQNEIGAHFRATVLPGLHFWQQPILFSEADHALRRTLESLSGARELYLVRLDGLLSGLERMDAEAAVALFIAQARRGFNSLVLHSLPRQPLQKTLTAVFFQHLQQSLHQSSNPDSCLKAGSCHCKLDLHHLPLNELFAVGLGGLVGERAFALAMHRFLQGSAIERRCFQVDWIGYRSVLSNVRSWMSHQVVPQVEQALAALKGNKLSKFAPADAQQLVAIAVNNIGRSRTSSLFDYVKTWPASAGAIQDIWEYLNAGTQADKAHVCQSFSEQIQRRLLHAGASTSEILGMYVNVIHAFKALDGRGVLLEKVAVPIRNYLRARDDTVAIIAASFLADAAQEIDASNTAPDRICHDITVEVSKTTLGASRESQALNWDDMEWMPDPIDAGPDYRASKSEDIIAQIFGLFDQEAFITEITNVLAQHLLHSIDPSLEKEIRLVELLKSRLDAAKLQATDVMINDMKLSVRLGKKIIPAKSQGFEEAAPTPKEIQEQIPEGGITLPSLYKMFEGRIERRQFMAAVKLVATKRSDLYYPKRVRVPRAQGQSEDAQRQPKFKAFVLSSQYWPQLHSDTFSLPNALQELQMDFEKQFQVFNSQRRLHFRPALGLVSVRLELEDRLVEEEDVPAWRASVIDAFSNYDAAVGLTVAQLVDMLQMDEKHVMDALNFWTSKTVLFQRSPGAYAVLENMDMDIEQVQRQMQQYDDMTSAVKSQDDMFRESAPMFETFIANMLRNQGAKEIGGMMGITSLLKMVLPTFTYGDEEVVWLLNEMEKKGQVKRDDGEKWSIVT